MRGNGGMASNCILYLPELFNSGLQATTESDLASIPSLLTLLARANCIQLTDAFSPLRVALHILGSSYSADTELPLAAMRQHDPVPMQAGTLWCADPVLLRADRDSAVMLAAEQLPISADEARQIITTLNSHFASDGLHFSMLTPHQWVMRSSTPWQLHSTEINAVIGRDVRDALPCGQDAQRWRRIATEIEMLLFTHPVNQQREAQQQWPITGVWLWGGGALPTVTQPGLDALYTDDANVATIAQYFSVASQALPANLQRFAWPSDTTLGLVLLQSFDAQEFVQLEAHWFAPLLAALRAGQLRLLILRTQQCQFVLTSAQLRRWWRRRHNLAHWCQHG